MDKRRNSLEEAGIEPPKAYLRRIERLNNPSKPPITMYQKNSKMEELKKGLSPADWEIAERLEKLREDRKKGPLPSDQEITERLARLRGEQFSCSSKSNLPPVDIRTDEEKCDDLLNQYLKDCKNESKIDSETGFLFKGEPVLNSHYNVTEYDSGDNIIQGIIDQALKHEVQSDVSLSQKSSESSEDDL